jgi:hypothetical protein
MSPPDTLERLQKLEYAIRQSMPVREDQEDPADAAHMETAAACLLIAPWLIFAWYIDCVKPYAGGGASLAYVTVLLYGTPGAILGALLTPWLCKKLGLRVEARKTGSD